MQCFIPFNKLNAVSIRIPLVHCLLETQNEAGEYYGYPPAQREAEDETPIVNESGVWFFPSFANKRESIDLASLFTYRVDLAPEMQGVKFTGGELVGSLVITPNTNHPGLVLLGDSADRRSVVHRSPSWVPATAAYFMLGNADKEQRVGNLGVCEHIRALDEVTMLGDTVAVQTVKPLLAGDLHYVFLVGNGDGYVAKTLTSAELTDALDGPAIWAKLVDSDQPHVIMCIGVLCYSEFGEAGSGFTLNFLDIETAFHNVWTDGERGRTAEQMWQGAEMDLEARRRNGVLSGALGGESIVGLLALASLFRGNRHGR